MKRVLSIALGLLLLLPMLTCSSVAYDETNPDTFAFDPYAAAGTDLNLEQKYKFDTLYIKNGEMDTLFFDVNMPDPKSPFDDTYADYPNAMYQYEVGKNALKNHGGTLMISLDELRKIYGSGTKLEQNGNDYTFYYKYNAYRFYDPTNGAPNAVWKEEITGTHEIIVYDIQSKDSQIVVSTTNLNTAENETSNISLSVAPQKLNNKIYVPFVEFAEKALGMTVATQGQWTALIKSGDITERLFAQVRIDHMNACLADKDFEMTGNRWFLIYQEAINKLVPYQVYIPKNYDGTPSKFTLMFHGGTGNENAPLARAAQGTEMKIENYADKYNYMILLPNAITSSNWGANAPAIPTNATQYVESQAEIGVYMCMRDLFSKYNADMDKLFVTGNSMGSSGTVYFATNDTNQKDGYRDFIFKAAAPTSGSKGDTQSAKPISIPMLYIYGERDAYATKVAQTSTWSADYRSKTAVVTVEHGHHSWSYNGPGMDIIFTFFDDVLSGTLTQAPVYSGAAFSDGSDIAVMHKTDGTTETKEMALTAITYDGALMVSLSELQKLIGPQLTSYVMVDNPKIGYNFYGAVDYSINNGEGLRTYRNTIVIKYYNKTINIEMGLSVAGGGTTTFTGDGIDEIKTASFSGPGTTFIRYNDFTTGTLTAAPIAIDGEVYVPAAEILSALGLNG